MDPNKKVDNPPIVSIQFFFLNLFIYLIYFFLNKRNRKLDTHTRHGTALLYLINQPKVPFSYIIYHGRTHFTSIRRRDVNRHQNAGVYLGLGNDLFVSFKIFQFTL